MLRDDMIINIKIKKNKIIIKKRKKGIDPHVLRMLEESDASNYNSKIWGFFVIADVLA